MDYSWAIENRDFNKIDKLNELKNFNTFWNDVKKLTKNVTSDHSIGRWQCLAEARFNELKQEKLIEYNKSKEMLRSVLGNDMIHQIEMWIVGKAELPIHKLRNSDVLCCNYLKAQYIELKNAGIL